MYINNRFILGFMKRNIAFLVILLSILLIPVLKAQTNKPITITSQTQKKLPNDIIHVTQSLNSYLNGTETFHGYYAYPVFPETFQHSSALNNFYKAKQKKDYKEIAQFRNSSYENTLQADRVYAYDHTFEVTFLSKHFLSILENTYTYTGGAHPNSTTEAHTFSLLTGKELTLENLFLGTRADIEKKVKQFLYQELEKNPDDYFPDAKKTIADTSLDSFHFYISKDGIVIFFNPYEISPYVRGLVEFRFPC